MVNEVKDNIETSGFVQLIEGHTRSWRGQSDSLLDHVWSNCDSRTVNVYNESRGASDHNLIGINISRKDMKLGGQNQIKIIWKNFDEKPCVQKFRDMRWNDILTETNVDIANSLLEDRICGIIDTEAPLKTVQIRTKYKNWISDSTKAMMNLRNMAREKAKSMDDPEDWEDFRTRSNDCTNRQRCDRIKYYNDMLKNIEYEKNSSQLFKTTKQLLG